MSHYFNRNMKTLRRLHKRGLIAVADALGVTVTYVHDWEVGPMEPSLTMLMKIADYYGVSEMELLRVDMAAVVAREKNDMEIAALVESR